jgi:hypothetical protein
VFDLNIEKIINIVEDEYSSSQNALEYIGMSENYYQAIRKKVNVGDILELANLLFDYKNNALSNDDLEEFLERSNIHSYKQEDLQVKSEENPQEIIIKLCDLEVEVKPSNDSEALVELFYLQNFEKLNITVYKCNHCVKRLISSSSWYLEYREVFTHNAEKIVNEYRYIGELTLLKLWTEYIGDRKETWITQKNFSEEYRIEGNRAFGGLSEENFSKNLHKLI